MEGPDFWEKTKGPCQDNSRDEHRIWVEKNVSPKGSDPTFKELWVKPLTQLTFLMYNSVFVVYAFLQYELIDNSLFYATQQIDNFSRYML